MANSKLFRAAQNRSSGLGASTDGYFGFSDAVNALKKTQIKKCEPYKFLLDVAKKLNVKRDDFYAKILFSNNTGQVKLSVGIGKNKNAATNGGHCYFVFGNLLTESIDTITPLNKKASAKAVDVKNKKERDILNKKAGAGGINKNSIRFRKKKRSIPNRAKLKISNKKTSRKKRPDTLVVKDFSETGQPIPQQLNESVPSMPQKDFSIIFEDANSKLYDENPQQDIRVENPPGVAKFIGLGVDVDRPSVIASIDLSPIIYDDTLDVYDQALLDKRFKIESVYKRLTAVSTEDTASMVEVLEEFRALTADAVQSAAVIAILDEQIVEKITFDMQTIASQLGFNTSLKLTQIYVQGLHDLGGIGISGVYETENGQRKTSIKKSEINIDESYDPRYFDGANIKNRLFKGKPVDASDPENYQFGDFGTFLGYYASIDPGQLRIPGGTSVSLGDAPINVMPVVNARLPGLMHAIYYELVLSKLLTNGDSNVKYLKDNGYTNIVRSFLGQFADPRTSLNDVKVPEKLAAIAKFNTNNQNFYPLEQFISTADGLNGRTFLDAVVQPAVGALVEDTDPNFDLLNSYTEKTRNSLDDFFKYTDVAFTDGGGPIVYNEIVLAFIKCITDRTAKVGSTAHPKSSSMQLKNSNLESAEIALILFTALNEITKNTNLIAHIYNTIGYSFFKDQGRLAKALGEQKFTGLTTSEMDKKIRAYAINKTKWNPSTVRAINDREDVSKILNNAYSELSRFFNLLENNLMTSIDLLLSDAGLIGLTTAPEYNTLASGFFVNKAATVRGDGKGRLSDGNPGTYEATAFSGIPRIYLRTLLCMCAKAVSTQSASWLRTDVYGYEKLVKAAKVAVENINPENGPVRWKVTHGQWPPESGDTNDLTPEDYNKLVPEAVRTARAGEVDVDIELDADGTPSSINVNDPAAGWEFIDSVEGFCPLTLFIDGEDNSERNTNLIRANRALFDNHYDLFVTNRTRIYKLKQMLEKPLQAFQNFPQDLEDAAGKVSLDSLKKLAELPGIDGQELIKFTSPNQIGNMRSAFKKESHSDGLRFLPNKLIIADREYRVARRFIDDYKQKKFASSQDKCVVQSIGIPCGLLAANAISKSAFSLTREAEFMFYPDQSWAAKTNKFHPSIYLVPGSFNNCDENSAFDEIVNNTKYLIANDTIAQLMTYTEVKDFLELSDRDARNVLTNHCIDHSLKLALKITTGADFSEDTFRVNKQINNLFISKDGQGNIETLIKNPPDNFADFFKENGLDTTESILRSRPDMTATELNSFIGALSCRLISPEDIAIKVLGPRIFDRVLNLFVHPDEHYSNTDAPGLKRVSKLFDGKQKNVFIINLSDDGDNSIRNDHFASYYYKVEKL